MVLYVNDNEGVLFLNKVTIVDPEVPDTGGGGGRQKYKKGTKSAWKKYKEKQKEIHDPLVDDAEILLIIQETAKYFIL